MEPRKGYTVAELVVVVLILGVLTCVAVPRLQLGLRDGRQAESTAWKIVTDLRRARSLAILHAATNPQGFALDIRRGAYHIVDLSNSRIIDSQTIGSRILCEGGSTFEFGPLGALTEGHDKALRISAGDRTFAITIVPATGMVKCTED